MTEYFVVANKDDHGALFQTRSKKWTRDITPFWKTTLNNSDQAYHRLPEAAYYINILANHMWADLYDSKDELKEKVKKLVGEHSFVEWRDFTKMECDEITRLQKKLPDIYPLE